MYCFVNFKKSIRQKIAFIISWNCYGLSVYTNIFIIRKLEITDINQGLPLFTDAATDVVLRNYTSIQLFGMVLYSNNPNPVINFYTTLAMYTVSESDTKDFVFSVHEKRPNTK